MFRHKVGNSAADRSHDVQATRLAGLPDEVVARAEEVLHKLEEGETSGKANRLVAMSPGASVDRFSLYGHIGSSF